MSWQCSAETSGVRVDCLVGETGAETHKNGELVCVQRPSKLVGSCSKYVAIRRGRIESPEAEVDDDDAAAECSLAPSRVTGWFVYIHGASTVPLKVNIDDQLLGRLSCLGA